MHRSWFDVTRAGLALAVPLLAACPDDATPVEDTGSTTDTLDPTIDASTSVDPDGSTSIDPVTTIDPDATGTMDDSSSSSEESTSGFVGCGDGFVELQDGELCDGDNLDGRTCITEDFSGGALACNPDCTLDTSGCTYACGDGEVQGDEQCEADDLDGNTCITQGFEGGDLECNADCTFNLTACENYDCGDNLQGGPEVCDGTDLDGEDCESLDFDSGTLGCLADCSDFDTSNCFVCGDGVIDPGEQCDGNALGGATCVSEGLEGGVISCANDCTLELSECVGCGNGDADPGEQCDGSDYGGFTCIGLGFEGGQPTCSASCTISDLSCAGLHTFCASPGSAIGPDVASTQSTIPVAGLAGEVLDVDVLVDANHTRVGDLDIDVRHVGANISVSLADDQCGAANDIDATFDQDASNPPDCVEPLAIQGNVLPLGNLDSYIEVDTVGSGNGTWELTIADQVANEGGTLDEWCVAITTGNVDGSLLTVRTGDDVLVALDPLTLEMTDIGPLGIEFDFGEIAWDESTGTMWMVDGWTSRSLYTVDIMTGQAQLVGAHNIDMFGLEVDPNTGTLYGGGYSPGGLYEMDQSDGSASLIGNFPLTNDGLAWDTLRNELVGVSAGGNGPLYRIDTSDAGVVELASPGFVNNCGFAYEPIADLFWAIDWSGDIFTYDPNNAYAQTLVMSGVGSHDGMAFVPGYFP
jgi:subtilisin-like proprotein convertase family protein